MEETPLWQKLEQMRVTFDTRYLEHSYFELPVISNKTNLPSLSYVVNYANKTRYLEHCYLHLPAISNKTCFLSFSYKV